jgi:hypothetical protein
MPFATRFVEHILIGLGKVLGVVIGEINAD